MKIVQFSWVPLYLLGAFVAVVPRPEYGDNRDGGVDCPFFGYTGAMQICSRGSCMKNARVFMLLLAVVIFLPLTANAWVFGIPFKLSQEQLKKLSLDKDTMPRSYVIVHVHNGNENVHITELSFDVEGKKYTVDTDIKPNSAKLVNFKIVVDENDTGSTDPTSALHRQLFGGQDSSGYKIQIIGGKGKK